MVLKIYLVEAVTIETNYLIENVISIGLIVFSFAFSTIRQI